MGGLSDKPEKTVADVAHALAKAAMSAVPIAGGPAAELFALIVSPPLEKRRNRWLEEVERAVRELQQKVSEVTPETLSQNNTFVTTLLHATQIAGRSHQQEKIDALRNAVMNAALPDSPEDVLQQVFLSYVDDLTTWHLQVLKFFDDPRTWATEHGLTYNEEQYASPLQFLASASPDPLTARDLYSLALADLEVRGLLDLQDFRPQVWGSARPGELDKRLFSSRTTALGKAFLKFISAP